MGGENKGEDEGEEDEEEEEGERGGCLGKKGHWTVVLRVGKGERGLPLCRRCCRWA